MYRRVAIAYNKPCSSRYDSVDEVKAVLGVLDAVEAVHGALRELGYHVIQVPLAPPLEQTKEKLQYLDTDLVFNLFEGFCGYPETEALVADILSEIGTPYTGCPGEVLRLALDKARAKSVLQAAGIRTPNYQVLNPQIVQTFHLSYPCIVKPRGEDASHGMSAESLVSDFAALERRVKTVSSLYGGEALVEEYIGGREFNATVMGNSDCIVLPASEICYSLPPGMPRILTFAAKWEPDSLYFENTRAVCPAEIGAEEQAGIAGTAAAVFRLLGCQGYARVDMRMDEAGQLNVIEVNPNPDVSPGYGAARQAEAAGMNYTRFIEKIVQLAQEGYHGEHRDTSHDPVRQSQHSGNTAQYVGI